MEGGHTFGRFVDTGVENIPGNISPLPSSRLKLDTAKSPNPPFVEVRAPKRNIRPPAPPMRSDSMPVDEIQSLLRQLRQLGIHEKMDKSLVLSALYEDPSFVDGGVNLGDVDINMLNEGSVLVPGDAPVSPGSSASTSSSPFSSPSTSPIQANVSFSLQHQQERRPHNMPNNAKASVNANNNAKESRTVNTTTTKPILSAVTVNDTSFNRRTMSRTSLLPSRLNLLGAGSNTGTVNNAGHNLRALSPTRRKSINLRFPVQHSQLNLVGTPFNVGNPIDRANNAASNMKQSSHSPVRPIAPHHSTDVSVAAPQISRTNGPVALRRPVSMKHVLGTASVPGESDININTSQHLNNGTGPHSYTFHGQNALENSLSIDSAKAWEVSGVRKEIDLNLPPHGLSTTTGGTQPTTSHDSSSEDNAKHIFTSHSLPATVTPMSEQNACSTVETVQTNFLEFCVVGIDRCVMAGMLAPEDTLYHTPHLLDVYPTISFSRQNANIKNKTPNQKTLVDGIEHYCFPNGVKLALISKTEAQKQILHPLPLQTHVLQFRDVTGVPTYGAVVTGTDILPLHVACGNSFNASIFLTYMRTLQLRVNAIQVIQRAWQRYACYLHSGDTEQDNGSNHLASSKSSIQRKIDYSTKTKNMNDNNRQGHANGSRNGASNRDPKTPSALPTDTNFTTNHRSHASSVQNTYNNNLQALKEAENQSTGDNNAAGKKKGMWSWGWGRTKTSSTAAPMSNASGQASSISNHHSKQNQTMNPSTTSTEDFFDEADESENGEWFIVSQRAYCLLSEEPIYDLLIQALTIVATEERIIGHKSPTEKSKGTESGLTNDDVDEDDMPQLSADLQFLCRKQERDVFLETVQTTCWPLPSCKLSKAGPAEQIPVTNLTFEAYTKLNISCHPRSVASITGPPTSLNEITRTSHSSHMSTYMDWAVSAAIRTIPPETLLQLHALLLMEKSVVVYSENPLLASLIPAALVHLLNPFKWAGVFVPLLTLQSIAILQAPVPYVVGTVRRPRLTDVSPSAAVLYVDDFLALLQEPSCPSTAMLTCTERTRRYLVLPAEQDTHHTSQRSANSSVATTELVAFAHGRLGREAALNLSTLRLQDVQQNGTVSRVSPHPMPCDTVLAALACKAMSELTASYLGDYITRSFHSSETVGCKDLAHSLAPVFEPFGRINIDTKKFEYDSEAFVQSMRYQHLFHETIVKTQMFSFFVESVAINEIVTGDV